jgi:hypothetical protein
LPALFRDGPGVVHLKGFFFWKEKQSGEDEVANGRGIALDPQEPTDLENNGASEHDVRLEGAERDTVGTRGGGGGHMDGLLSKIEVDFEDIIRVDPPVIVLEIVAEVFLAVGTDVGGLPDLPVVIPDQGTDIRRVV